MNDVLSPMGDDDFSEEKLLNDLRADGRFVWDYPGGKVCVYPSNSHVVLMSEEDGERVFATVDCSDVEALCNALKGAALEADSVAAKEYSEYLAFEAIQRAKEGAPGSLHPAKAAVLCRTASWWIQLQNMA